MKLPNILSEGMDKFNLETLSNKLYNQKEPQEQEVVDWYYAKDGEPIGPYSKTDLLNLVNEGVISDTTYVLKKGQKEWAFYKDSEIYVKKEEPKEEKKETSWYYAEGTEPQGPFTEKEFLNLYKRELITDKSLVWTSGMEKWCRLQDSDFQKVVEANKFTDPFLRFKKPLLDKFEAFTSKEEEQDDSLNIMDFNESTEEKPEVQEEVVQEDIIQEEPVLEEVKEEEPKKQWFYITDNNPSGPYNETEMLHLYEEGVLDDDSTIWYIGATQAMKWTESELVDKIQQAEDQKPVWHCISKALSKEELIKMYRLNQIDSNTLVFKDGEESNFISIQDIINE